MLRLAEGWTFRAEGYYKDQPRLLRIDHGYRISRTSTTCPAMAAAATIAGDIKSVRPAGEP